jgi:hypothetical protein
MERPPQTRALGQPPVLSVFTAQTPSSGIASTIYVSPEATPQHQLRQQQHTLVHSDGGGAPLRRGPKRAARGEIGVADESPAIWGSASSTPVNTDRAGTNGHGPSPGLGVSPDDDRDSSSASPSATATTDQPRKKQKRNKPTLSCFECVERKTKVCNFSVLKVYHRDAEKKKAHLHVQQQHIYLAIPSCSVSCNMLCHLTISLRCLLHPKLTLCSV